VILSQKVACVSRKYIGTKSRTSPWTRDTSIDLAARTFLALQPHARRFRHWRERLAWFTIFRLLSTAFAYWDAGLGRVSLERLDQNWKTYIDELRDNPTRLFCDNRQLLAPVHLVI
jgi:hypothetical protein